MKSGLLAEFKPAEILELKEHIGRKFQLFESELDKFIKSGSD